MEAVRAVTDIALNPYEIDYTPQRGKTYRDCEDPDGEAAPRWCQEVGLRRRRRAATAPAVARPPPITSSQVSAPVFERLSTACVPPLKTVVAVVEVTSPSLPDPDPWAPAVPLNQNRMAKVAAASPAPDAVINLRTSSSALSKGKALPQRQHLALAGRHNNDEVFGTPALPLRSCGVDLSDFQAQMARVYGARDRDRGIPATIAWLTEEVGELARSVRKGTISEQLHELGDVLAWLASLADQLGLSLDSAAARYADGCPACGAVPCACPPA